MSFVDCLWYWLLRNRSGLICVYNYHGITLIVCWKNSKLLLLGHINACRLPSLYSRCICRSSFLNFLVWSQRSFLNRPSADRIFASADASFLPPSENRAINQSINQLINAWLNNQSTNHSINHGHPWSIDQLSFFSPGFCNLAEKKRRVSLPSKKGDTLNRLRTIFFFMLLHKSHNWILFCTVC